LTALKDKPEDVSLLFSLANIYLSLKEGEEAIKPLETIITLMPTHYGAVQLYCETQKTLDNLDESIKFLSGVISDSDVDIYVVLGLAQSYRLNKQSQEAIDLLKRKIEYGKTSPAYWLILGDTYMESRLFLLAEESYKYGLGITPKHYSLSLRYISILEILNNYQEALNQAHLAYINFENDKKLEILITYLEFRNGNFAKSKKMLSVLSQANIKHPLINNVLGAIYLANKDFIKATEFYSNIYSQNPSSTIVVQLARSLKFSGKSEEAEKLLESYISNNPKDEKIRLLLVSLYPDEKRGKRLEQYLELASLLPNNATILNNMAWDQLKLGMEEEALENSAKAYYVEPSNSVIASTYGAVLIANKQYEVGINILETVVIQDADDMEAKLSLAEAYYNQKNYIKVSSLLQTIVPVDADMDYRLKQLKDRDIQIK